MLTSVADGVSWTSIKTKTPEVLQDSLALVSNLVRAAATLRKLQLSNARRRSYASTRCGTVGGSTSLVNANGRWPTSGHDRPPKASYCNVSVRCSGLWPCFIIRANTARRRINVVARLSYCKIAAAGRGDVKSLFVRSRRQRRLAARAASTDDGNDFGSGLARLSR